MVMWDIRNIYVAKAWATCNGRRLTGIRYGDSGPHGWASSGEISVSLPPRQRRSARPVTSGIRANQFKVDTSSSRSLPVMGNGLAKLVEEPNVTVDDRWNQVVTVDGNPSWCWILWKGEGSQNFVKTSSITTLRCGMMAGCAARLPSFLIRAPSARKSGCSKLCWQQVEQMMQDPCSRKSCGGRRPN
ncbi:unnamed protein product [Prunus brigantina]